MVKKRGVCLETVLTVGGVDGTTWYNLLFPSNKRLYLKHLQAQ